MDPLLLWFRSELQVSDPDVPARLEWFSELPDREEVAVTGSKKLVSLVWLAAQEVAAARSNDTYKEYAGAALARMISVNRSTWLRVYASHWARFKAAFVELDAQALQTILIRREAMDVANALEM